MTKELLNTKIYIIFLSVYVRWTRNRQHTAKRYICFSILVVIQDLILWCLYYFDISLHYLFFLFTFIFILISSTLLFSSFILFLPCLRCVFLSFPLFSNSIDIDCAYNLLTFDFYFLLRLFTLFSHIFFPCSQYLFALANIVTTKRILNWQSVWNVKTPQTMTNSRILITTFTSAFSKSRTVLQIVCHEAEENFLYFPRESLGPL